MLIAVLSGFFVAAVAPQVSRVTRGTTGWLMALIPLGLFLYFLKLLLDLSHGPPLIVEQAWIPSLNVTLSFHADGLSLLFALLISGIGALIALYAGGYLHGHPYLGRFYAYLMMFMASMLGVVLSNDLIGLFVFWELTSVSSYLLIGFNNEEETSRDAALQALLTTGLGGLAMLGGLVLLGHMGGTYRISELVDQAPTIKGHALYLPALLLILTGAFTKSAQFPFHFWLPNAMAAPTPVSAYLHSSTMVKAGLFLLARLSPVLAGTAAWQGSVTTVGAITMFFGAWMAIRQNILKKLLAYSTVSALGVITMLLGIGTEGAVQAAVAFLLAHALYKAALFLMAGSIDHETGTKDITQLGGLFSKMPKTAIGAGIAGLSMAGIPLMFGFVAKETVYEAVLHTHGFTAVLLTTLTVVSSMLFLVVAACVAVKPFYGAVVDTPKQPHEAPLSMWLGPATLGLCTLGFGLFPNWVGTPLLGPAADAILHAHGQMHLALWHGFSLALLLSVITVAGGVVVYWKRTQILRITAPLQILESVGPEHWYGWSLNGMMATARVQTRILQNGYLRYYLMTILMVLLLLCGGMLIVQTEDVVGVLMRHTGETVNTLTFYEFGLCVIMVIAIGATVHSKTRLAAVASLGVVGFGMCLIFVLFGAPDLAMTQFVIETLTVILFVLVFYHLPSYRIYASKSVIGRDLCIAISVGVLMGTLVLVASDFPHPPGGISAYFSAHSYDLAHGRNVVNVILVDFRGIDTMGEITVLAVAAVGAFSLLKLRIRRRGES